MRCLLMLLLLGLLSPAGAEPKAAPIRFVIGTNWAPPLAEFDGERLSGGLIQQFSNELAARAPGGVRPLFVPRRRLEYVLEQGEADLTCFISPYWMAKPDTQVWSAQPLLVIRNVLVGRAGVPRPASLDALPIGTAVSTVRGYRYVGLDARFADGRLRREDAPTELNMGQMLVRGRTDYAVMKDLMVRWLHTQPDAAEVADWQLELDSTPVYCAVPRARAGDAAALLRLAERAAQSPAFQRALQPYRRP